MSTRRQASFFERHLDPTERLDEMLFALIMVLSITLGVGLAADQDTSASQVVWAIVPFMLITSRFVAARVSNALVPLTLFAVGFGFARLVHADPWKLGWSTALFGLAMVVIVVLLGA